MRKNTITFIELIIILSIIVVSVKVLLYKKISCSEHTKINSIFNEPENHYRTLHLQNHSKKPEYEPLPSECPKCFSYDIKVIYPKPRSSSPYQNYSEKVASYEYKCTKCGFIWTFTYACYKGKP